MPQRERERERETEIESVEENSIIWWRWLLRSVRSSPFIGLILQFTPDVFDTFVRLLVRKCSHISIDFRKQICFQALLIFYESYTHFYYILVMGRIPFLNICPMSNSWHLSNRTDHSAETIGFNDFQAIYITGKVFRNIKWASWNL